MSLVGRFPSPDSHLVAGGAEYARTVLRRATSLDVATDQAHGTILNHGTDSEGDLLVIVGTGHPLHLAARTAPGDELIATIYAADMSPAAASDRVRGRVRATGRLAEVPPAECRRVAAHLVGRVTADDLLDVGTANALLRIEVRDAAVARADSRGTESIDRQQWLAAKPDPFACGEAALLAHLARCHRPELNLLLQLADPYAEATLVGPVALDRFGVVLRVIDPADEGETDLRFPFAQPAESLPALNWAMSGLIGRARRHLAAHQ